LPTRTDLLKAREIAITGRLASMSREEAIRRILAVGGRYVEVPGPDTVGLVVGLEGWPLRNDGQLTRSLEIAREMQQAGHAITILSEEEFLVSLGEEVLQVGMRRLYTTEQLCRILEIPTARLRGWVRGGLVQPVRVVRRLCWFDFQQVASLRALQQLQVTGVSTAQIRKSLEQLRQWMPSVELPLTQLESLEKGGPLLIRMADGRLVEPSGQMHLDFGAGKERSGQGEIRRMKSKRRAGRAQAQADDWFDKGLAAEDEGQLEDAANCYMNALLAGGPQAETVFNLGNVLYSLGRNGEALQRFLQAIEIDPDYVEAWNNLGGALASMGKWQEAVGAYRQALSIEPNYGDAHCNLAETLEQMGQLDDARQYWLAYLQIDPTSAIAQRIRKKLDSLGNA
jgi:DNA-binding transcriptional MerR regulator